MSKGTQRPPTFIGKTYAVVSDPATDHLICWDHDGETFVVRNPERLAQDVFPSIFAHASYPSFTRALNAYGFRQVSRNNWKHADFRRGGVSTLDSIQRRRKPGRKPQPGAEDGSVADGSGGDAEPHVQLELLGFNAAGCMALIESQRRSLSELQTDIAQLKAELRSARSEELQLQSTVTGVLSVLVNEYGRQAIESALGCARLARRRRRAPRRVCANRRQVATRRASCRTRRSSSLVALGADRHAGRAARARARYPPAPVRRP